MYIAMNVKTRSNKTVKVYTRGMISAVVKTDCIVKAGTRVKLIDTGDNLFFLIRWVRVGNYWRRTDPMSIFLRPEEFTVIENPSIL